MWHDGSANPEPCLDQFNLVTTVRQPMTSRTQAVHIICGHTAVLVYNLGDHRGPPMFSTVPDSFP